MTIHISNLRKSLLEAYSKNGTGSLLTYKPFWKHLIPLIFVCAAGYYFIKQSSENEDLVLYVFFSILCFLFILGFFLYVVISYLKWRRQVLRFIKEFDKFDNCSLILHEKNFELTSGLSAKIEKWSDIKEITIEETHVSFLNSSGEAYLIPAKSMSRESFEILVKTIREKIA